MRLNFDQMTREFVENSIIQFTLKRICGKFRTHMGFAQEIFLWLAHSNARQTEKMVHAYLKNFRQNDDNNGAIN